MSSVPNHIVVVMDGNGRWAKQRGLSRNAGHKAGVEATRALVENCVKNKIKALTIFAFSSENWQRPKNEVSLLMELFLFSLKREVSKLNKNKVQVRFIGEISAFSTKLRLEIEKAQNLTCDNSGLVLSIAVNYGGRWDIVEAVKKIAREIENGHLTSSEIDHQLMASKMCLSDLPAPDLFIRTSGEKRISNFLLWQIAYTECYFTDTLWPDFDEIEFNKALQEFASRVRRFGKTGDQLEGKTQNV